MTPERKSFSPINVSAISQPRRSSAPSMSAFQVPVRGSHNLVPQEPQVTSSNRAYLIAIVALLFGVIGVLTFLLFL
jgi:hypothetical protein